MFSKLTLQAIAPVSEPRWQDATRNTNERLGVIHQYGVFGDVIFQVEERGKASQYYAAHMLILSSASTVFERQFYLDAPPPIQGPLPLNVTVTTFTNRAFKTMLSYAYSPQGRVSFSSPVHAMETYHVAREYEIVHLKEICGNFLKDVEFSPEDIVPIYEDELHVEIQGIHQKCLMVVDKKPMLVMRIAAEIANCKTIEEFLERPSLVIPSELALLQRIIDGAQFRHCDENDRIGDSTCFLKRSVFPFIRFLTMTAEQFAIALEICQPVITKEEGYDIFYKLCQRRVSCDHDNFPEWCNQITKNRIIECQSIEIIPTGVVTGPLRTNSLISKLEIKATRASVIFTRLWFRYKHSSTSRVIQCKLNIRNPVQMIAFDQVKDFNMDGSEKYLRFATPLPVLCGETAEINVTLDDGQLYEVETRDFSIPMDFVVVNVKCLNQLPDDKLFGVTKLDYAVLYL